MRLVIQRVKEASVSIDDKPYSTISQGLLILLGISEEDTTSDADVLIGKVCRLRIFSDAEGKMNLSVQDVGGELLVVSQFTLYADTRKGNRPSFIRAAKPEKAIPLYEYFVERIRAESALSVKTGIFGADMKVNLLNDGPVTILMDANEQN